MATFGQYKGMYVCKHLILDNKVKDITLESKFTFN